MGEYLIREKPAHVISQKRILEDSRLNQMPCAVYCIFVHVPVCAPPENRYVPIPLILMNNVVPLAAV
jgi:hypothetical protein